MCLHECIRSFKTRKIDDCKGEGFNRCFGLDDMKLEVWYEDQDGTESYCDNWIEVKVNYCPYCGLRSKDKELV